MTTTASTDDHSAVAAVEEAPLLAASRLSVMRGERAVLTDIDLQVRAGTIVAVVGPNGAGKTTLLQALLGTLPSSGSVTCQGRRLASLDRRERARLLAYVPQRSALVSALSVLEVVAMGRYAHAPGSGRLRGEDERAVEAALEATELGAFRHRSYLELSGGEQRRVLLARALATGARTILLDEPTASLDVRHRLSFVGRLRQLTARGHAVLAVLHHLDDVLRVADQVVLLGAGRIVTQGSAREVLLGEQARAVYGVELVEGAGLGYRRVEGA